MQLYKYPLIAPFDIFCQQEVNWIYIYVPKAQQVTCDRGTRKSYVSVSDNNNVSSQCSVSAQIEQV